MTDSSNMDPLNRLEAELERMKPTAISVEMMNGIERALAAQPMRWADRCLLAAMSLGAVSACVIVVMLLYGEGISPPSATPRLGDDRQLLAGAEIAWVDRTK